MFRSEEMSLVQLFIQPEAAYTFVARAGEAGIAQFSDLNTGTNNFQRRYVGEVRRCEEMERKVRAIAAEIRKEDLPIPEVRVPPRAPNSREITELEAHLERTENEIIELANNSANLISSYQELVEFKHVLARTNLFFQQEESYVGDLRRGSLPITRRGSRPYVIGDDIPGTTGGTLNFVAGVVRREKVMGFERMLWLMSRGNVFLRHVEIEDNLEDPQTNSPVLKNVFVAFFQGNELKNRVMKVCSGFHVSVYQCPSTSNERMDLLKKITFQLEDLKLVLAQTKDHRQHVLIAVAKYIDSWSIQIRKMKAVYHTMNTFNMDIMQKCLVGECWVPKNDLTNLNNALTEGSKDVGTILRSVMSPVKTKQIPPTFNRSNKFSKGFQNLIDAYGVSAYGEVNPALYTIITFPFLFAVMFGDIGHGLILTLFGAFMCLWENKIIAMKSKNEIGNLFFGGRYIILLMGLFSIYTGAIYNDIFSKSFNIFGSSWANTFDDHDLSNNDTMMLDPLNAYKGHPYPFGMDPVWQMAEDNKINFQNSFKMKLSIIFGVIHMLFGVSLSIVNHLHFKNKIYILLDFLPQFLFLLLIFFYLVVLIFMKWVMYGVGPVQQYSPGCAPSVLIIFIHMMLFSAADKPQTGCISTLMFNNQETIQLILMVIALLCIPALLIGKPLYLLVFKKKNHHKANLAKGIQNGKANTSVGLEEGGAIIHDDDDDEEEDEPAGEIIIHQMIHTVEYILSTVSHTASYLRLWALSLAHGQLSDVLWKMVLKGFGLSMNNHVTGTIALFVIFTPWALLTLAILVAMEGLSAFLHTLRLHWVEFMSKFYKGDGYIFQPFDFRHILSQDDIMT